MQPQKHIDKRLPDDNDLIIYEIGERINDKRYVVLDKFQSVRHLQRLRTARDRHTRVNFFSFFNRERPIDAAHLRKICEKLRKLCCLLAEQRNEPLKRRLRLRQKRHYGIQTQQDDLPLHGRGARGLLLF